MANARLTQLVLTDRMPGSVNPNLGVPPNGWDNTRDNFKTTSATDAPAYPLGTKIMAYTDNTNCPGWYTMAYLMYHDSTATNACISQDFSDGKFWCSHTDVSTAQLWSNDTSACPYFVVASCYSHSTADFTKGGPVVVPCATLNSDGTATYVQGYGDSYGWFWVGGVCPCKDVTIMDSSGAGLGADFTTEAGMRIGPVFSCMTASTLIPATDYTIYGEATDVVGMRPMQPFGYICMSGK